MTSLLADRFVKRCLLSERGGVSTWQGEDLETGERVVLKVARPEQVDRERLEHECQLLDSLESPHLPRLLGYGPCEDGWFLSVSWKDGETLEERLSRGPLTLGESLAVGVGVCQGLVELHGQGILHGDIKPSNVLLGADGQGHLLDGFSPRPARFAPPEQVDLGPPSDLYSLGLVLTSCLGGQPCPEPLQRILRRLVQAAPADRYQTARGLLADLLTVASNPTEPRVLGTQDVRQTFAPPQFVGRLPDLERLVQALGESRTVVIVRGAGGSGKTRLLDEFERVARRRQRMVLRANLQAWGSLADALVAEAGRELDVEELQTARDALGTWFDWLGRAGRSRTEGLVHFVNTLAEVRGGVVLLLDDAHARPEDVVEFLSASQSVPHRSGRWTAVVSCRESPASLEALATEQVSLAPLSRALIGDLVTSMLGTVGSSLLGLVQDCSDGNPFLAMESLYGLWEANLLVQDQEGVWQVRTSHQVDAVLSFGTAARLAQRVVQLPAEVVDVLSTAALLGTRFTSGLLQTVMRLPFDTVAARLETARQALILWAGPDGHWLFRHDRLREQALSSLSGNERRTRHRQVANTLVELQPGRVEEIAWHYSQSDTPDLAVPYAMQAGDRARAAGAHQAAIHAYRLAGPGTRALPGLAECLQRSGAYAEAEATLLQALDSPGLDAQEAARLHALRAQIAGQQGDRAKVRACIEEALGTVGCSLPPDGLELGWRALLEVLVQWLRWPRAPVASDIREAEILAANIEMTGSQRSFALTWYFMFRALNLLEGGPARAEVALLLAQHACMATNVPALMARSLRCARRSIAMADKCSQALDRARVLARAMNPYMLTADLHRSLALNLEAEPVLEACGQMWELNIVRFHVSTLQYFLGRLEASVTGARALFDEALLRRDATIIGVALHAWARASLGQVPEWAFERTRPLMTIQSSLGWLEWVEARGLVLFYRGRYQEAIDWIEPVWEQRPRDLFHAGQMPTWLASCYCKLAGDLPPEAGQQRAQAWRRARHHAREAVRLGRAYRIYLPHALRAAALVAAAIGHVERARSLLDESLSVSQARDMAYEHALSLEAWGDIGRKHGWEGADEAWTAGARRRRALEPEVAATDTGEAWLDVARTLAVAPTVEALYDALRSAVLRCLRPDSVLILAGQPPAVVRGPKGLGWSAVALEQAQSGPILCEEGRAVCAAVGHQTWIYAMGQGLDVTLAGGLARMGEAVLERLASRPLGMAQVAQLEQEYRSLYDGVGVALLVLDGERRIVACNPHASTTLGSGLVGQFDTVVLHPQDHPADQALFDRLVAGTQDRYCIDVRCPQRRSAWVQMAVSRLGDRYIRAISDISYRRLREVALFEEVERRTVADAVRSVVSMPVSDMLDTLARWKDVPPTLSVMQQVTTRTQALLVNLGHLMFELRTPPFQDIGLVQAIRQCARECQRSRPGLEVGLDLDPRLDEVRSLTVACTYRIVLESLESVRRDTVSERVTIRLNGAGGTVRGTIVTDGLPPRVSRSGRGQVELIGGRIEMLGQSPGLALIVPDA